MTRTFRTFALALALIVAGTAPAVADESTVLVHAGRMLDVESGTLRERVTIHVRGERIVEVTEGFAQAADGDEVIDLADHTVLPGLMDMHTHLTSQSGPAAYLERFQLNPADLAFRSAQYAERTLHAGFTTVRDLGDQFNVSVALRNAIREGRVAGPRILTAAKSIATTGGHADPTNGWAEHLQYRTGPTDGVINGEAQAREAVRQRYKDGADLIKITATGGVLSVAPSGDAPQFMDDEIEAIVATAADYGFHVAAHAHGRDGMLRAVRAGVHSIEHGTYMDDDVIEAMKAHGTWYVPTILAGRWVSEKAEIDGFFPEVVREKAATIGPLIQDTFARAWAADVNIVFGTDSGVSPHGDNAREFELMVEAGMPELDAIRSATIIGARFLDMEDDLGSIEAGKYADLIAVAGNPLEDISELRDVRFVMKAGRTHLAL